MRLVVKMLIILFMSSFSFFVNASSSSVELKINVAMGSDLPPMHYIVNDKLVGFEVDLINLFGKEYKYFINIINPGSRGSSSLKMVMSQKADVAINALTITDERRRWIGFSKPYFTSSAGFLTRRSNVVKKNKFDAGNYQVILINNSPTKLHWATNIPKKYNKPLVVNKFSDAINYLTKNQSNNPKPYMLIYDWLALKREEQKNKDVTLLDFSYLDFDYGMAYSHPGIADKFNNFIESIQADGRYEQLMKKWFKLNMPEKVGASKLFEGIKDYDEEQEENLKVFFDKIRGINTTSDIAGKLDSKSKSALIYGLGHSNAKTRNNVSRFFCNWMADEITPLMVEQLSVLLVSPIKQVRQCVMRSFSRSINNNRGNESLKVKANAVIPDLEKMLNSGNSEDRLYSFGALSWLNTITDEEKAEFLQDEILKGNASLISRLYVLQKKGSRKFIQNLLVSNNKSLTMSAINTLATKLKVDAEIFLKELQKLDPISAAELIKEIIRSDRKYQQSLMFLVINNYNKLKLSPAYSLENKAKILYAETIMKWDESQYDVVVPILIKCLMYPEIYINPDEGFDEAYGCPTENMFFDDRFRILLVEELVKIVTNSGVRNSTTNNNKDLYNQLILGRAAMYLEKYLKADDNITKELLTLLNSNDKNWKFQIKLSRIAYSTKTSVDTATTILLDILKKSTVENDIEKYILRSLENVPEYDKRIVLILNKIIMVPDKGYQLSYDKIQAAKIHGKMIGKVHNNEQQWGELLKVINRNKYVGNILASYGASDPNNKSIADNLIRIMISKNFDEDIIIAAIYSIDNESSRQQHGIYTEPLLDLLGSLEGNIACNSARKLNKLQYIDKTIPEKVKNRYQLRMVSCPQDVRNYFGIER